VASDGPAADELIGGGDFDDVDGGGDDTVRLGGDSDRFTWRPGDGNDVVDGQARHDVLFVFGTTDDEVFGLQPDGRAQRFTRDVGDVVMDVDGIEEIDPVVFGGADTIALGDLTRTAVTEVDVNLEPALGAPGGDGRTDHVAVTGTERVDAIAVAGGAPGTVHVTGLAATVGITYAEAVDELAVHTRGGDDSVDSSGLAAGTIGLTSD
jgi:hypothetical protein